MGGLTIMVYLVRQGETDWNLLKKFNGCTDIELNQTGIEQAQYQAENLKDVNFDVCFCSPQKRAVQTCEIIYKGKSIPDDRLTINYFFNGKSKDYDFSISVIKNGRLLKYDI